MENNNFADPMDNDNFADPMDNDNFADPMDNDNQYHGVKPDTSPEDIALGKLSRIMGMSIEQLLETLDELNSIEFDEREYAPEWPFDYMGYDYGGYEDEGASESGMNCSGGCLHMPP
jgi:hypothetical protein